MSYPFDYASDNPVNLNVGKLDDDDYQVIDDLLTDSNELPPLPVEPSLPQPALVEPKPVTRLMGGTFVIPAGQTFQVMNEDSRRKNLVVRVTAAGTDYAYVTDENSKGNDMSAGRLYNADLASFGSHNGPVYLSTPSGNSAAVTVSLWSVTL